MRIHFLAGTLAQGGAERQLYYILRALRAAGHDVKLYCLTRGEWWEEHIRALGVPVEWVGRRAGKLLRLAGIARRLRRDRPDIFQAQHFYTNLYVAGAARLSGCREVCAIRSDAVAEVASNGWLGWASLRAPRFLAANSRAGIENAVRLGVPRERLHLLPNVVDSEQFQPAPKGKGRVLEILAVGRLVAPKRHDRLLRLLAALRPSLPFHARVVGDGPLRGQLETEAARLGLGPDLVEFCGARDDLAPFYRDADLFLLPSDREGTPNVLLEAMASGLCVLASSVGGVPDVVRDGDNGYLADPRDEAGFGQKLEHLAFDERARSDAGGRARVFIEECHAVRRLPEYMDQLYRMVHA